MSLLLIGSQSSSIYFPVLKGTVNTHDCMSVLIILKMSILRKYNAKYCWCIYYLKKIWTEEFKTEETFISHVNLIELLIFLWFCF